MQSSSQKCLKRLQGSSFWTKSGIRLSVSTRIQDWGWYELHWCRMETAAEWHETIVLFISLPFLPSNEYNVCDIKSRLTPRRRQPIHFSEIIFPDKTRTHTHTLLEQIKTNSIKLLLHVTGRYSADYWLKLQPSVLVGKLHQVVGKPHCSNDWNGDKFGIGISSSIWGNSVHVALENRAATNCRFFPRHCHGWAPHRTVLWMCVHFPIYWGV